MKKCELCIIKLMIWEGNEFSEFRSLKYTIGLIVGTKQEQKKINIYFYFFLFRMCCAVCSGTVLGLLARVQSSVPPHITTFVWYTLKKQSNTCIGNSTCTTTCIVTAANPEAKNKEIMTMLGHGWSKLSDKQKIPYDKKGNAEKARYLEEMKGYTNRKTVSM